MTIAEFLEEIIKVFRKSGIFNPENEAQLLACHILGVDKTYLYIHRDEYIDEKILLGSAALINERCKGRPLAYITGKAYFYGEELTVDERVLIPRSDTECMVEECIEKAKNLENPSILDLCTGSGCIALALSKNVKNANILASDISLKSLQIARYNLRGEDRVLTRKSDLFENISEIFDIIITNPPYVALKDKEGLQKEVKDYEPSLALFSGEDGLDLIRVILKEAPKHLKDGGFLFLEHDPSQSKEIKMLANGDFKDIEIVQDLAGLNRYLVARKA